MKKLLIFVLIGLYVKPALLDGLSTSVYFDDTLSSIKHMAKDLEHQTNKFQSRYFKHRFISSIYIRYLQSLKRIHILKINDSKNSTDIKDELISDYTMLYKYCHLLERVVNDITERLLFVKRYKILQNVYKLLGLFEEAIFPGPLPIVDSTNVTFPPSQIGFDIIKRDFMFFNEIKDFFNIISDRYDQ